MKTYRVYFIIKTGGKEILNHIDIYTNNSKEACKECKQIVLRETGRNAFRPTTKEPDYKRDAFGELIPILK